MKCPFCDCEMKHGFMCGGGISNHYMCDNTSCWVNGEFSRYIAQTDNDDRVVQEDYALGDFYVKVFAAPSLILHNCDATCLHEDISLIYRMVSYMLVDEVKVPRALWLNPINTAATLDKLRTLIMFS